jgi:hypothetical protein
MYVFAVQLFLKLHDCRCPYTYTVYPRIVSALEYFPPFITFRGLVLNLTATSIQVSSYSFCPCLKSKKTIVSSLEKFPLAALQLPKKNSFRVNYTVALLFNLNFPGQIGIWVIFYKLFYLKFYLPYLNTPQRF